MDNLFKLEKRLEIIDQKLNDIDFTQEFVDAQALLKERNALSEKVSQIKWGKLSLKEKILKRKEDLTLTTKYFEKFKEEVEKKYLFKKKYVRLVDIIESISFNSPLLIILLKSLNTSMYVNFSNRDSNTHFIVEELEKINSPQLLEIISLYRQVVTSQTP